jgi:3-oxoacyl-[acyl-carrier protein] reductase
MFDLSGKTALVTGASGGIGRAISVALHAQGARLVVSGTRQEALDSLVGELGGERVHAVACDLADTAAVDNLVPAAESAAGVPVDILVNNAGITRDNLFMRMSDAEWDSVIAINLSTGFRLARACLKGMMRRRYGRIIAVTSVVGTTGNAGQANYAASKAGMVGLTKSLAAEAATRNVTANCIAPGFIETPMTDVLNDKQKSAILSVVPMGRLGQPTDVAAAAVFLASSEAAYVTGQTLHVNGGMAMI